MIINIVTSDYNVILEKKKKNQSKKVLHKPFNWGENDLPEASGRSIWRDSILEFYPRRNRVKKYYLCVLFPY